MRVNWKWIRSQLEALPYILAACAFGGALWFIASMVIILGGEI
jgi:hypothetical protein